MDRTRRAAPRRSGSRGLPGARVGGLPARSAPAAKSGFLEQPLDCLEARLNGLLAFLKPISVRSTQTPATIGMNHSMRRSDGFRL
jgi:hypothetical protein